MHNYPLIFVDNFIGVAAAVLFVTFIQCIYHGVYIGYGIYYMFSSLRHPYYWTEVGNTTTTAHKVSSSYVYIAETSAEQHF